MKILCILIFKREVPGGAVVASELSFYHFSGLQFFKPTSFLTIKTYSFKTFGFVFMKSRYVPTLHPSCPWHCWSYVLCCGYCMCTKMYLLMQLNGQLFISRCLLYFNLGCNFTSSCFLQFPVANLKGVRV